MNSNVYKLQVSANALNDHISRLYRRVVVERVEAGRLETDCYMHIDDSDAFIRIIKQLKHTTSVRLSHSAALELVDDLAYQAEFGEDDTSMRKACQNAVKSLRKQLARDYGVVVALR